MRRRTASPAGLRFWIPDNPFPTWSSRCIRIISDLGREPASMRKPDGTFRLDRLTAGRYRMEGQQRRIDDHGVPARLLHFFEVTSGDIRDMAIHVGHGLKLQGTVQGLDGRLPEQLIAY